MPYQATAGDIIALDNAKAGALVLSQNLATYTPASTDPVRMFARRDAFRTVAEVIATNMAAIPLNLYRQVEVDVRSKLAPTEHRVAAALEAPQPHLSQFRWVEALQLDAVLHDRWAVFVEIQDDDSIQFHRLPARRISFALDSFGRITDVAVWAGKRDPLLIPAELCLFDVGYDPEFGGQYTSGYPVSRTLEASATELDEGAKYRAALLAGGPRVPMYIKRPAGAPDWIRSGGRDRFKADFAGYSAEKAGQVPILDDGMELASAPQLNPHDVDYRETRKAAQIEFAIALHVPPELVGYREGTLSNVEAFREMLYVDVLGGRIAAFRQALNRCLRVAGLIDLDHWVEENLAVRLASTPEKQASVLQTQVGAPIRSRNEARRMLNLPPIEGGDDLVLPLNVILGGLASPTDTTGGRDELARVPDASRGAGMKALLEAGSSKASVERQRDRFRADLDKALAAQASRVDAGLGRESSPGSLADAFDLAAEDDILAAVILPHAYALAVAGAATVLTKWNPDADGFDPDVMLPWLRKASISNAHKMNTATQLALSLAIASPGEAGWRAAVDDALALLKGGGTAEVWSQTIATASSSFGSQDAAKASGLTQKTWRAAPSKSPRASHAAIDGETVDAGELFSNGLRWPGDPVGSADENANCHCRVEWSRAT